MKQPYLFSPISTDTEIYEALKYITQTLTLLIKETIQQPLPINTLKIFAHYFDEYDYLLEYIKELGPPAQFNSQTSHYAVVEKSILRHNIQYIGVRVVDPYRLHVGCGDVEIKQFDEFKEKHLQKSPFVRGIDDDMIELWHPDYDVLGYIVPEDT